MVGDGLFVSYSPNSDVPVIDIMVQFSIGPQRLRDPETFSDCARDIAFQRKYANRIKKFRAKMTAIAINNFAVNILSPFMLFPTLRNPRSFPIQKEEPPTRR